MKYALMVYSDQSDWDSYTEDEAARRREESIPAWIACFEELGKADPNLVGYELEAAADAKVIRVPDGRRVVTDGPFAETKEQIGGVFLADLPDLDEAIRLSALVPAAQYGSMEIRPIAEH